MNDDELYGVAVRAHPIIKPDRWYIANRTERVVVVDQPGVGFATAGAAGLYVRQLGRHIDQTTLTVIPGTAVTM